MDRRIKDMREKVQCLRIKEKCGQLTEMLIRMANDADQQKLSKMLHELVHPKAKGRKQK